MTDNVVVSSPRATFVPRSLAFAALVLCIAAGASVPLWLKDMPFALMLASQALIAGTLALSLDLLTGNTGLLSFGHAAWYGFGAYVVGLASRYTPEILLLLPFAAVSAMAVAVVVGLVLVRQIGKTFAILTLAFSQILYSLVFLFSKITGGEDGLQGVPPPTALGFRLVQPEAWYWFLYTVLILSLLGVLHLRRAPLGRAWLAIRDNNERARFVGIDVVRLKVIAYALSAALASVSGGLFVLFNGAASPDMLSWFKSGQILMYVVLGGVGTIVGPIFGAAVFTFVEHYVSSITDSWLIYFGGLFVLVVIVAPGGLFGLGASLWARRSARSEASR